MIRSRTSLARTTMTGLAAIACAACSSGAASSPAPSTVAPVPSASPASTVASAAITLRLATPEEQNLPSQPFLDRFVSEVARASGGQLAVDVTYNAGTQESGKEQRVASQVIAGDVDLAVVPVRAWSDVGVTSLQALAAPFLIDSDALLETVTTDDTVIEPLLEGMRDQGLIGLAVWPEDLRHPFTFEENGRPLVSPADFKGRTIWAITSGSQQELIEALGATMIDDRSVDPFVADGSLRGAESGLWAGAANLPGPPTATGDVTFYPKIEVIVAEDAVWSRLSPDQQAIVRAAAVAARDLAIADHRTDADLAKAYCAQGGKVALAGPANVAKFMDAAKPIYVRLESDPLTATALAAIRALKSSTPASVSTACKPPVSATATIPPVEPGPPIGMIPDGTYQQPMQTMEDLLAKGVDATNARNNAGTFSMVIKGSTLTWTLKHPSGQAETCSNTLTNVGDRIRWTPDQECSGPWTEFRWTLVGDQLTLKHVDEETNHLSEIVAYDGMAGGPWTKVE